MCCNQLLQSKIFPRLVSYSDGRHSNTFPSWDIKLLNCFLRYVSFDKKKHPEVISAMYHFREGMKKVLNFFLRIDS